MRIHVTSRTGDVARTAASLKAQGMKVDSVLEAIGVISGEVALEKLPALERMPGVTVEREQTYQLPPPDAPIQ